MPQRTITIVATYRGVKKKILWVKYNTNQQGELNIHWSVNLNETRMVDGRAVTTDVNAHASYHDSGEVVINYEGKHPISATYAPPRQITKRTQVMTKSIFGPNLSGSDNSGQNADAVIDVDSMGLPFIKISLAFLPPSSIDKTILKEVLHSGHAQRFVIRDVDPWCEITVYDVDMIEFVPDNTMPDDESEFHNI